MFLNILLFICAALFGYFGLRPLKESAEYRFTKIKPLLKGVFYIGTGALAAIFVSWWALIIGVPIAYLIEKAEKNDRKLLN